MNPVILRSKVKNLTNGPLMLRWLEKGGRHLQAGEEVEVDGAYPTAVVNPRFVSSCLYDIENGRVSVALVTSLPTEKPSKAALAETAADTRRLGGTSSQGAAPASVKPAKDPAKEERWGKGTIEDQKPAPVVLPGHEETLAHVPGTPEHAAAEAASPKTLKIFDEDTTLTDDQAQTQQEQVAAGEAAYVTGDKPVVPPATAEEAAAAEAAAPRMHRPRIRQLQRHPPKKQPQRRKHPPKKPQMHRRLPQSQRQLQRHPPKKQPQNRMHQPIQHQPLPRVKARARAKQPPVRGAAVAAPRRKAALPNKQLGDRATCLT